MQLKRPTGKQTSDTKPSCKLFGSVTAAVAYAVGVIVIVAAILVAVVLVITAITLFVAIRGAIILSEVVALSTVAYVILTLFLVEETWRIREAQTKPDMSISLQHGGRYGNLLEMVIQNIGPGEAVDVKFEAKTDFKVQPDEKCQKRFQDLNIIKNRLRRVAPKQSYSFLLGSVEKLQRTKF